jgi:hypothetical protein
MGSGRAARLIWLNLKARRACQVWHSGSPDFPMRKFAFKAIFSLLTLNRAKRKRLDWDRTILILSSSVTVVLVALYIYGKSTSRW